MGDLQKLIEEHKNISEKQQVQAGQAIAGSMGDEHKNFAKEITRLIQSGEIDVFTPETFFHQKVYSTLKDADRAQVDQATVNIADQLRHVHEFFVSKKTPDESPQLETMIEQLWQMKERVEKKYGDVFKF